MCQDDAQFANGLRKNKAYCTNSFTPTALLIERLAKEGVVTARTDDVLLVFEGLGSFTRFEYYAASPASLVEALGDARELWFRSDLVADVVYRKIEPEVISVLKKFGFNELDLLTRMRADCKRSFCGGRVDSVEHAAAGEVGELLNILRGTFDERVSRLPSERDLASLASQGGVFVERVQGVVAGIAVFKDISGPCPILDQIMTRPEYMGQGIASRLLERARQELFIEKDFFLWAASGALTYYEKLEFEADGLKDCILCYERRRS